MKHLTYANVAATLALVFSMSTGALAASHYLITSRAQIKPSVLRTLQGPAGPPGPSNMSDIYTIELRLSRLCTGIRLAADASGEPVKHALEEVALLGCPA